MRIFYAILANTLAASLTNTSVWFAVTFWAYLTTKSVVVTSVMAGVYVSTVAVSGFFLGSLVDRFPKKNVMLLSSICSLLLYALAILIYTSTPPAVFANPTHRILWAFIILTLLGAIAGNVRAIALSTLVTALIPPEQRDKANGLVGTANGIAFLFASIVSGLAIGFLGMFWVLTVALGLTVLVAAHLLTVNIPGAVVAEPQPTEGASSEGASSEGASSEGAVQPESDARTADEANTKSLDVRGTIRVIKAVPGLFALIFFSTFNNFLGGVFMSLMDAYGLLLVSVQVWGAIWGFLSLGFIVGGLVVARAGLGKNPLRTLMLVNVVVWAICIFFTAQASIVLLTGGLFIFLCLMPAAEAAEQTILQKVIPYERQGRVFGFAQSVEQAASPLTAFLIGPIAQFVFIPFMTTGRGVDLIGPWFGTGPDRGIALLFSIAGFIGLIVTLLAMGSASYRKLSEHYAA